MSSEHSYNETPDVIALLDNELQTCVMPSITDPANASSEELIRDLYKVLTGNGGPSRGLIYKSATTSVNIKLLRIATVEQGRKQDTLTDLITKQKERCDEIQTAKQTADKLALATRDTDRKVAEAERTNIRKIGLAIRDNKALIAVVLVGVVMMLFNRLQPSASSTTTPDNIRIEQLFNHLLDVKLEQLQLLPAVRSNRTMHVSSR